MRQLAVCGIDPGKSTGIAAVTIAVNDYGTAFSRVYPTEVPPGLVAGWLENWLDVEPHTLVACERYVITRRTTMLSRQYDALEVTGVVKHVCGARDVPMIEQMKSDTTKIASNGILKTLGWYSLGMRHANDAARHALLLVSRREELIFKALMS